MGFVSKQHYTKDLRMKNYFSEVEKLYSVRGLIVLLEEEEKEQRPQHGYDVVGLQPILLPCLDVG